MAIKINFDLLNNAELPTLILANRNGNKIGKIDARNVVLKDCLNNASEITFDVYKELDGVNCHIWDRIKNFKLLWCKEWDTWFSIRVEIDELDNETKKTVYCVKLGVSELSQIMLYDIEVNTKIDISREDYEIPTVFYNPEYFDSSLLDRLMEKAPHYTIIHVDSTLMDIQKTFSFNDVSIYDAFQEVAEELGCLFVFNSNSDSNGNIQRTISIYDLNTNCVQCGYRGEFTDICPECGSRILNEGYGQDTTIFITSDSLADDIQFITNTDSVKNCFILDGGDDLINATIKNCNPNGTNYIWYISNDVKEDMSANLVNKLENYDELYAYYQNDYKASLNSSLLTKYNDLINKYVGYNEELEKINSPILGYPALMNAYYNTIDLSVFLQSILMPTVEISTTNAIKQAALLTRTNMSPVAVTNLSSVSLATANNAVLSVAKVLIDSRYQVKVESSSLSGTVWSGNFKVSDYSDEEDTAISNTISININDDLETYIQHKIDKSIKENVTDKLSISGLFSLSYNEFCNELKKYCLSRLLSFQDACQAVLDILIEQNIPNSSSWGKNDLYDQLYLPYYNKLNAIQNETSLRESEIEQIIGVYDSDGDLINYGLQNYIIDIRNEIQDDLDFEQYLGKTLWLEFCSYRREDKYSNSNYISDGLNNAELFKKALEFIKVASREIYKSAELQHSISSSLKNLLIMDEFKPLIQYFEVGNWIRLQIDDAVYKLRLIEYEIDYENLGNISVEFSDVMKIANGLTDVESIIQQASSMATSYDAIMHQANQGYSGNKRLSEWVEKGLSLTNMKIISGSENQEITWDSHGFLMKEYFPVTDTFSDKQLKIINKGLYVTDDNWLTSRAGIGNFIYYDPRDKKTKEGYGVIADTLIGNLILSEDVGIYTSTNDITLNKNGVMVTNGTNTITINPNANNFFVIENSESKLMWVDKNGDAYFTGQLNIGDSNFIVDGNGNVTMNGNIILAGNITWDTSNSPVCVLYARTNISKPLNQYDTYPSTSSTSWHKTLSSTYDYYVSYSYDGGKTWTDAIKTKGVDGEDGVDGSDANVPGYIKSTYIDFSQVSSPQIKGNFILGSEVSGGTFWDSSKIAYLKLGTSGTYADMSYYKKNGTELFKVYDNLDSTVSLYLHGHSIGWGGASSFCPSGSWDFKWASVKNITATFA